MFELSKDEIRHLNEVADFLDTGEKVAGWKKFSSTIRDVTAYGNKNVGLVIKCPAFILEPRTPLKFRVPTVNLKYGWVVQPLVERKNLKLAVETLRKNLRPYLKIGYFPDLHVGNVGWYEGKPLMFDW